MVVSAQLSYVDVNVSVANQMIESDPNLTILDVRTQSEYDSGHLQNATLIPVSELGGRLGELDKKKEILVYCASGGRSATASQTLVDNGFSKVYNMLGGITAWKNAGYWVEIVHNGDLIINGTQTFVIENCTYTQTGNVMIKDNARLFIEDTTFIMNLEYTFQFSLLAENNAQVTIENSTMLSQFEFGSDFKDSSEANLQNVRLELSPISSSDTSKVTIVNSYFQEAMASGASTMLIVGSRFRYATNLVFYGSEIASLSGLNAGFYEYWNLRENETVSNVFYNYTLIDTYVQGWSIFLNQDSRVTVLDSSLIRIAISYYGQVTTELVSLRPGFCDEWSLNNIKIVDCQVEYWGVLTFEQASVTLRDCDVGLNAYGDSHVSMVNSTVGFHAYSFLGEISVNQSALTISHLGLYYSSFYVHGEVAMNEPSWKWAWISTNITRNYGVSVRDPDGNPIENAELTLYDVNNASVWSETTSSLGDASFNVTFTDSNCTDTLRLGASKGELFGAKDIAFLSDTPVTLVMNTTVTADINNDGSVDIYDAILLANAYNSIPGSSNWNSKADLNSDNIVDIYDAIILAGNYGKTA
jgi:rhodanese-related sulfurtransferase